MGSHSCDRHEAKSAGPGPSAVLPLDLDEIDESRRPLVGGKAANLAAMLQAGLPVPRGFCLPTAAFQLFLTGWPGRIKFFEEFSEFSDSEPGSIAQASRDIGAVLADTSVSPMLRDAILARWREFGMDRLYAVRSSATVEDAAARSFAGQFESTLNVRGADALLEAIKSCWRSVYSERALAYLAKRRVPLAKVRMAVVVQEMVVAEHAGVVFTADPISGAVDRFVVECVCGLGEGLVQGRMQPERWVIERPMRTSPVSSPHHLLSSANLARLCALAGEAERLFGQPQDIEWAEREGQFWLLQSRPITTQARPKTWAERQVWTNLNAGEIAPDVMTPLTWSLWRSLLDTLFGSVYRLLGAEAGRAMPVGLVAGRVYANANTLLAAARPFSFLLKEAPDTVRKLLGGGEIDPLTIPPEDLPDLGFRWPKYILSWPRILFDLITHSPRRGRLWLERFKQGVDQLARADIESMSTPALTEFCTRLLREPFAGADLLYVLTSAAALPVFQMACRAWLNDTDLTLGYRLFAALGGMPTAEAGLELWGLAALAQADPATKATLDSEHNWRLIRAELEGNEHGREFLRVWDAFMNEHGHHCRGELELFNARWSESPEYILETLRSYHLSMGRSDPLAQRRRLAREREELTESCRQRLKNPIKRWIFTHSLRRAQKVLVFREEFKNQWVRQTAVLRHIVGRLGQRLHEEERLSRAEDIFFLEIPELAPVSAGAADFDWRERIANRRREYEQNLKLAPPQVVVGTFDSHPVVEPAASGAAEHLDGIPVSPGVVAGRARVIPRTDDNARILPGEILIAPFTDPAWSPYFVAAGGLVIEQGGILSHGSIVAREYGLPAVTNVGSATRFIRTGDLVEVDGNRGRVTILARA